MTLRLCSVGQLQAGQGIGENGFSSCLALALPVLRLRQALLSVVALLRS
jgi:hypothetical protein